jgi:hypothetical protein
MCMHVWHMCVHVCIRELEVKQAWSLCLGLQWSALVKTIAFTLQSTWYSNLHRVKISLGGSLDWSLVSHILSVLYFRAPQSAFNYLIWIFPRWVYIPLVLSLWTLMHIWDWGSQMSFLLTVFLITQWKRSVKLFPLQKTGMSYIYLAG